MELDFTAVGKRIKKARQKKGYSQEKLAEMVDLSQQHIGNIEVGNNKFSISVLLDICNCLDTTPDALLFDNLSYDITSFDQDFKELLNDATPKERAILYENARELLRILQEKGI